MLFICLFQVQETIYGIHDRQQEIRYIVRRSCMLKFKERIQEKSRIIVSLAVAACVVLASYAHKFDRLERIRSKT